MKNKIISSLVCLASLGIGTAYADNLPDLGQMATIGNVALFPTQQRVVWFAPMDFSSNLDCPSSNSGASCVLRVFNRMPQDEISQLNTYVKPGQVAGGFRDVDSIVQSVEEHFDDLNPILAPGKQMILKSLVLDDRMMYAGVGLRVDLKDLKALSDSYETTGLGKFVSQVHFTGQYTGDYLAIEDTSEMSKLLQSLSDNPLSLQDTKSAIRKALAASTLTKGDYSDDEATTIATSFLIQDYFSLGRGGLLRPKMALVNGAPKKLVLVNEVSEPVAATCTATLELKKGAVSTVVCGEDQ
jgi:hypothetical protein